MRFLFLLSIIFTACNQQPATTNIAPDIDPHSYAEPEKAFVNHLDLAIKVDFAAKQITGKATWKFTNANKAQKIIFDVKGLHIARVTIDSVEKPAAFALGKDDPILGQSLEIEIKEKTSFVHIYYSTSPNAGALQWLDPQQTAGKKFPFLFTQSEPILARSWVPCQDGPGIRFTYNATVTCPPNLLALMSAENPQYKNAEGIYHFRQQHAIPSYLLALAIGDLAFQSIDERTGVYAEPSVLNSAAWEFADMGRMVNVAENLYGPYRWGRYDVLVLPPSFPYGGMENPNLTFATPTVIAGDRSLVSLIAHELAHSWSGNLVTNASWNDMWLNEGFTTYFERRIVEAVYGKEEAQMQEVLGLQQLYNTVAEMGANNNDTKLKGNYKDRDPDEGSGEIVYEKGYAFLRTIEEAVGRERLDTFLRSYFDAYAFKSRTTEEFVDYLNKNLIKGKKELEEKIQVTAWVYNPGIPNNIPKTRSAQFNNIDSLLQHLPKNVAGLHQQIKSTNEILYFLRHLPADLRLSTVRLLDAEFGFTKSGNSEILAEWLLLSIKKEYKPAYDRLQKFLQTVGRRKFVVPLYKELIKTPSGKAFAKKVYAIARENYHPVTYNTVDELLK